MTRRTILTLAGLLALLAAGAAEAATLFSPPLVPAGDQVLDCYLVNVGDKPRAVQVQALTKDGVPVGSPFEGTLEPGHENVARAAAGDAPRYCKFVVSGPRSDFRASILVVEEGGGSVSALSAQ